MTLLLAVASLLLSAANPAPGDAPPSHAVVRIHVATPADLRTIFGAGVDHEGASGKPGGWMEFVVTPADMAGLGERGVAFEVVDPDPAATAARRLSAGPFDALGFGTGSMGGYYTLAEVGEQLDSMRLLHPTLVSEKQEFGYSIEGRPIWAVRISDNPGTDEPSEPEVLYTALTHGREPAGMMTVIYYMWWLLENHATDPAAAYLVNNRQIWFIPVVNVDGYAYNESTNPAGGGFWRKNRRNNGNGTWGVDLNRNYGTFEYWDAPNGGSSTTPGSDTYRGTSPFSEPETQTIDAFMRLHSIRTCLNYHTYSRLLIYPFGYLEAESPDSLRFREFAFDMTRANRYVSGTDQQTVNYSTRGNSDDYMYGDTTKFRTFALTPEVGTSFWPPSSQILPLALENLGANIHFSYAAGALPVVVRAGTAPDTAAILPGAPFTLELSVRNKGLDTARDLPVSIDDVPGVLSFPFPLPPVHRLAPGADTSLTIQGTAASSAEAGSTVSLPVRLTDPAGYGRTDTVLLHLGDVTVLLSDDAESGTGLWSAEGNWEVSTVRHDGALSFTDSPSGPSAPATAHGLQTLAPIDLTGQGAARLSFWTRWAIEPVADFGRVKVSPDSGATWTILAGGLSNVASGSGAQEPGTRGYDGYTPGPGWVREEIDLSGFAGSRILLRFELAADGSDSRDGWYIDDIVVTGYRATIPGGTVAVSTASLATTDLAFGEWPGAGDGIDAWIGETELAPPPGPGAFDARWVIDGTNGGLTDIRDTLASAADSNVFTLRIQAAPADYPITIRWDRAALAPGAWIIADTLPGSPHLRADMWRTDEATLAEPSAGAVRIVHATAAAESVGVPDHWALVSLPVFPADAGVATLFPDAHPTAFSFDGAYRDETTLVPGPGYWIRNDGPSTIGLAGTPLDRNVVGNPAGEWILVGAAWCPVPRIAACPDCDEPPLIYGYRNGYYLADTLHPGEGYWYRGSGTLELDCRLVGSAGPASPAAEGSLNTLAFLSPAGGRAELRFGLRDRLSSIPDRIPLPPAPPSPAFDARFETQNAVEYFTKNGPAAPVGIRLSFVPDRLTAAYRAGVGGGEGFVLEITRGAGPLRQIPLSDGTMIDIPPGSEIRLTRPGDVGLSAGFRVDGNFPNPFNATTSFSLELPAAARVTIRVLNLLGQEVDAPVVEREVPAGRHVVGFDAGHLASGAYAYTVTASFGGATATERRWGRFVLLR